MNDNRMKQWMESVDDDLLEEAQRPLPAGGGLRRWGALAACFCAAALALALWQPWNAAKSDCGAFDDANGSGAGDYAAMDKSFAAPTPSAGDAEPLSATLVLPADAELASDKLQFTARSDAPAAAPSGTAVCTIVLGGYDYDYGAVYASAPLPAPDGALPETIWQLSDTLTVMLYGGGAVGWYDAAAGIQWYCVAWDGGAPLVTAFALMDAQSYTVPTAPSGAETQGYDLFDLDGMTVTEVTFTLDGRTWRYRMAPTMDVTETIPDISGAAGGSLTAEGAVRWCAAALRWDEGGAGCIIWKDVAPGLVYSLTVDTGASETLLSDTALLVFQPAQEES